MIWLTWRQLRTPAAVVFGVLAIVAVVLAVTGPHLVHLYDTTVEPCASQADCGIAITAFTKDDRSLRQLGQVLLIAPALIGIFWGAPLVARELELNTFRLVWTQSVSRTRWLALKLGVVGLVSVVVTALLSLMVTWWSSPFDKVSRLTASPFAPSTFDRRDIVPIAYAAFGFALGATTGVIIRRTLPAMAVTLVAFISVRAAFVVWVRPHLMTPLTFTSAFIAPLPNNPASGTTLNPADWILKSQTITASGRVVGQNGSLGPDGRFDFNVSPSGRITLSDGQACRGVKPLVPRAPIQEVTRTLQSCLDKLHIREVSTYQPISRYWEFQWYESAIFVGLALVLVGACFWWVRRRLS